MSTKKGLFSIWMAILGIIVLIGLYTTYKLFTTCPDQIGMSLCSTQLSWMSRWAHYTSRTKPQLELCLEPCLY